MGTKFHKSEIDHLEDGYRWRKYGQKAVKNSPFPRFANRLTGIKDNEKFRKKKDDQPPGLKHVVDEAKEHHNVKYAYVWHVLAAYWGGVNPIVSVALKTLIVIHRTLRGGDPTFREELQNFQQRGCVLQLANFKDDSSPIAWDCSTWVRTYGLFLEEQLECFRILKYDIEAERIPRLAQGQDKEHKFLFGIILMAPCYAVESPNNIFLSQSSKWGVMASCCILKKNLGWK